MRELGWVLGLCASLAAVSCGDDSDTGDETASEAGACYGAGWQGDCDFRRSCKAGDYWLFCQDNQTATSQTLEEMGYDFDGSFCLCVIDRDGEVEVAREVDATDQHCLDQFDTSVKGYHDEAAQIVEDLCEWSLE